MKKYVRFFWYCLSILFSHQGYTQILAADSKGQSSILFDANAVNIDIAETALSFNFNNFYTQTISKRTQPLWGVSASGKNNEGLANLLAEGKFLPNSKLKAFIGLLIRTPAKDFDLELEIKTLKKDTIIESYESKIDIMSVVDTVLKEQISVIHPSKRKEVRDGLKKAASVLNYKEAQDSINSFKKNVIKKWASSNPVPDITSIQNAAIKLVEEIDSLIVSRIISVTSTINGKSLEERYFDHMAKIQKKVKEETAARKNTTRSRVIPYLSLGVNGSQIKLYDENTTGAFAGRFVKTPFTGATIDLGVNYDVGPRWLLGLSLGYEKAVTLDSLTDKDYVIRTVDTLNNQQLISEKKETGYTGNYLTYDRLNFRFDALYFAKLTKESNLVWNVIYGRYFLSFNEKAAVSPINIGSAINFYKEKGKFAGGVYMEFGDILNEQYKYQTRIATTQEAKKALNDNRKSIFGRFTFGVVAKFAFQSIVNPKSW